MPGSQNSGLGYESNLLSELFVFTGNSMNPSRKHLLKCKSQGELIHTLNLAQRKRFFFCSPKGMLTRFCGESDKFNKCKRVSCSRTLCVCVCVCVCVCICVPVHAHADVCLGGGEDSYPNTRIRKTKLTLKKARHHQQTNQNMY